MRGFLAVLLLAMGCTTVPPGYAGIVVNNFGTARGVQDYPVKVGRVVYNLFTEDVYKYPTFVQTAKYMASHDEGAKRDESITFSSIEGSSVQGDVALTFSIETEKVPHIFVKYRQPPEHILDNILRNGLRDAFNRYSASMRVIDIVGPLKETLVDSVTISMRRRYESEGFHIEQVTFLSAPRPVDATVTNAINAAITATQSAIAAENKVRQSKAEAEQAAARGQGTADSILAVAEGQAKANLMLAKSLTPELVEWAKLTKWDGKLPTFMGGVTPFVNIKP